MSLLTLYAKKTPTKDTLTTTTLGWKGKLDTTLFSDPACKVAKMVIPWHYSATPRRNQKTVMYNCWRWNLVWVNSATRMRSKK